MKTLTKLLTALLATCISSTAHSDRSNLCREVNGKFTLDFNIKPSIVVNSDAVLDKTFNDVGIGGGAANETVFSLNHTLGQILQSSGAPNTAVSREAFLQTMLNSFPSADGVTLNSDAGILMPFEGRLERNLVAADLLDESGSAAGMRPLALFNRFDLAPANWSHCGEHRIVYGKKNPNFQDRFLLIFEAMVPNPKPELGEAGCRPIAEFWGKLSSPTAGNDAQIAKRLAAFYYEGKTDPTLAKADLLGPVVHYKNYGGDGSRGQVRGNLFMQQPWQLREWLTQPTFDPNGPALAFVVDTVKNNPLSELYKDDLTGDPILNSNVSDAVTVLHGDFVQALATGIRDNLMSEESPAHQSLAKGLGDFELGTGDTVEVSEAKVLLNTIGLGNDNRFNEHQSMSQEGFGGKIDAPTTHAGPTSKLRTMLDQLSKQPTPILNPQTGEIILNRAQASTCAGCHMTSPGKTIRQNADSTTVLWPAVVAGGFVHVDEDTRVLSPALETSFLPFRRYLMGRHLCDVTQPAPAPAVAAAATAAPATPTGSQASSVSVRFTDQIIREALVGSSTGPAPAASANTAAGADDANLLAQAAANLNDAQREALRQTLAREIGSMRRIEENTPGAFVEVRRSH